MAWPYQPSAQTSARSFSGVNTSRIVYHRTNCSRSHTLSRAAKYMRYQTKTFPWPETVCNAKAPLPCPQKSLNADGRNRINLFYETTAVVVFSAAGTSASPSAVASRSSFSGRSLSSFSSLTNFFSSSAVKSARSGFSSVLCKLW